MRSLGLGPSASDRYRVRGAVSPALKPAGGPPARVRGGVLVVLLPCVALVTLAGCGSSENGVASKSGKEILAASKEAAKSADSVHVVGKNSQGRRTLTINMELGRDSAHAKLAYIRFAFEATRIGNTLYVKGGPAFYENLTGSSTQVPQGTWLKGPANGKLAQIAAFTDLPGELDRMLSTPGTVTKGATTTVNGQKVIELKETTKGYKGSLYVATDGKPYPVLFVKTGGGKETGRTTFSGWDEGLSLSAPSPAVDISTLKS